MIETLELPEIIQQQIRDELTKIEFAKIHHDYLEYNRAPSKWDDILNNGRMNSSRPSYCSVFGETGNHEKSFSELKVSNFKKVGR